MPSTEHPPHPAPTAYGVGWGESVTDLTCPSGAVAQVRRPGVQGLVAAGVLENVDQLRNMIAKKVNKAHGQRVETVDVQAMTKNPQMMRDIFVVIDKIVCYVVLQPHIVSSYRTLPDGTIEEIPWDDRDPARKYTDSIPEDDRYFLLNYAVGGTADLERFRGEFSTALGAVANGEDLPLQTQRAPRDRPRTKRRR